MESCEAVALDISGISLGPDSDSHLHIGSSKWDFTG